MKIEYTTFQDKDGNHVGVVVIDGRASMWSQPRSRQRIALPEVKNTFHESLFRCNHQWGDWSDEHQEDTEWGGYEYVQSRECECCGLLEYSVSERSIY